MGKTKIDWADKVWNPVTGCTKVSAGCKNCYAERLAGRFKDQYPEGFGKVTCHEDRLGIPDRWQKPWRVFVNSMSDLFHPAVPFEFIDKVFAVMAHTEHTYMVLTKRPERMKKYIHNGAIVGAHPTALKSNNPDGFRRHPLWNVWLGVSVEDQKTADERIPLLLETPSVKRFVSYEPALGPVVFDSWLKIHRIKGEVGNLSSENFSNQIDLIIMGGESGSNYRPMNPEWAREVAYQCKHASVPFYFKQMSGARPKNVPTPEDLQIREWPIHGGHNGH